MRFLRYGRVVAWYHAALAIAAGTAATIGIVHESGVRNSTAERVYRNLLLPSDKRAEGAYRELLAGHKADAVQWFEWAVRADSASPYRWCDYAEALLASGDAAGARRAIARAVELGPNVGPVGMRAMNLAFSTGDRGAALAGGRRLLAMTNAYDGPVFMTWTRMEVGAGEVVQRGLPDARSAKSYLTYVTGRPSLPDAQLVWGYLDGRGMADEETRDRYLASLVGAQQYDEARRTWARYGKTKDPGYPEENRIYDGSFECARTKAAFDWRIEDVPGIRVDRDESVAATGKFSLRMIFDGTENTTAGNVSQRVIVDEGSYTFEAQVRTAELSTDEGIAFRIFDPTAEQRLDVRTQKINGTHDWTMLSARVAVPAALRMIEVQVMRRPSLKFDNKIRGTAWIDRVRLR